MKVLSMDASITGGAFGTRSNRSSSSLGPVLTTLSSVMRCSTDERLCCTRNFGSTYCLRNDGVMFRSCPGLWKADAVRLPRIRRRPQISHHSQGLLGRGALLLLRLLSWLTLGHLRPVFGHQPAILSIDRRDAARAYSLCGGSSPSVRTCRRLSKHWCMNFCLKPRPNSSLTQSPRSFGSRAVTTTASGSSILPLNVVLQDVRQVLTLNGRDEILPLLRIPEGQLTRRKHLQPHS